MILVILKRLVTGMSINDDVDRVLGVKSPATYYKKSRNVGVTKLICYSILMSSPFAHDGVAVGGYGALDGHCYGKIEVLSISY